VSGFDADAVADILGSTGKGAVADSALGLYRERGKAGAKLSITGRDIEERTLALTMHRSTGVRKLEGDADTLALTERRQELLDAIGEPGAATLAHIAERPGQGKSNTCASGW